MPCFSLLHLFSAAFAIPVLQVLSELVCCEGKDANVAGRIQFVSVCMGYQSNPAPK